MGRGQATRSEGSPLPALRGALIRLKNHRNIMLEETLFYTLVVLEAQSDYSESKIFNYKVIIK